jgi:hypothetical protein
MTASGGDHTRVPAPTLCGRMSPFLVWTQILIVVVVVIGMVVAIIKLA